MARQVDVVRQRVVAIGQDRRRVERRARHADRAEHPLPQRQVVGQAHILGPAAGGRTERVAAGGDQQVVVLEPFA